ncbi:hypothetical protein GQ457_11G015140 [Hibiscus cannabinus]
MMQMTKKKMVLEHLVVGRLKAQNINQEAETVAEEDVAVENKNTMNNYERTSYWDELSRDKNEVHKVKEFNALGKGKRSRKKYKELSYDECYWEFESDISAFQSEIERFNKIQTRSRKSSGSKQKSSLQDAVECKNKSKEFQQYEHSPEFLLIIQGQDLITLPASSNSMSGSESGELRDVDDGPHQVDSQTNNVEAEDGEVETGILELNEGDIRNPQNLLIMDAKVDKTPAGSSSDMEIIEEKLDVSSMGLTSADASSNLEGGLEIKDEASRCFNCGSYSHSLKHCPKLRDSAAVNNARKQHQKFKRNQNAASRNAIRSQGGKYDDLKPGVLGAETRELLGLGEFDPPPWLNRMREIGYPLGYLAPEDDDEPSGITIYADAETDGHEDGEIAEMVQPEPRMKMVVEFPGINAPIPAEADEKLWAPGPSSSEPFRSRSQSHYRSNHSSDPGSRGLERRHYGDYEDEGPPGVDTRPSSSYPPRYGDYDSPYSPRHPISRPRSPTSGRSYYERGRRSPLVHDDFASHGSYSSSRHSPRSHGSTRYENEIDDRWDNNSNQEHSSRSSHRHHSRR